MAQEHSTVERAQRGVQSALTVVADAGEKIFRERPTMEHVLLLLFLVVGIYMYVEAEEFTSAAAQFPQLMAGATIVFTVLLLARNYLNVVGPALVVIAGLYYAYVGGTAFITEGEGLLQLFVGVVLAVAGGLFRHKIGRSVETFVAEPMQMLSEEDVTADTPQETETDTPQETEADTPQETETDTPRTDDTEQGVDDTEQDADDAEQDVEQGAMYVYEIDDPRGPVVTGLLCIVYMVLTYTIGMLYATPIFVAAYALWARMEVLRAVALTLLSFLTAFGFYWVITDDIAEGWLTGWEPAPPDVLIGLTIHVGEVLISLTNHLITLAQWGVVYP